MKHDFGIRPAVPCPSIALVMEQTNERGIRFRCKMSNVEIQGPGSPCEVFSHDGDVIKGSMSDLSGSQSLLVGVIGVSLGLAKLTLSKSSGIGAGFRLPRGTCVSGGEYVGVVIVGGAGRVSMTSIRRLNHDDGFERRRLNGVAN